MTNIQRHRRGNESNPAYQDPMENLAFPSRSFCPSLLELRRSQDACEYQRVSLRAHHISELRHRFSRLDMLSESVELRFFQNEIRQMCQGGLYR